MASKKNGGIKIELADHEIEYLKKIHNAQALREMMQHPGWEIFQELVQEMVGAWENQHLDFAPKASRDAYWISGVRLAAARDFAKILIEQIAQRIDILNQPLRPPQPRNTADYDGDLPQNGPQPEGE